MAELGDLLVSYKQVKAPELNYNYLDDLPDDKYTRLLDYISTKNNQLPAPEAPLKTGWTGWRLDDDLPTLPVLPTNLPTLPTDNPTIVKNYFGQYFGRGVVAGIMGAMRGESNFNPKAINLDEKNKGYSGYGRGIFQWSNSRVADFEKQYGTTIEDSPIEKQLEYAWSELLKRTNLMNLLRTIDKDSSLSDSLKARLTVDLMIRGYLNGSNTKIASVDTMNRIYGDAHKKLNYKKVYNYNDSLNARDRYAQSYLK